MKRILSSLGVFGAFASLANAQLINDTFNTSPANPNDIGWYRASGTVSTFSGGTGALQFTSSDSTASVSVFKQFSETTLGVGETLTLSFRFTAFTSQPASVSNNHLRIGLFDTANTFTADQAASPWATGNEGYIMAIGGGSATATSNFFYRAGSSSLVSTTGATALGTSDTFAQFSYASATDVTFSITRATATEIRLNGSYTQGANTYTFTQDSITTSGSYADKFDTLYVGYGLNVSGRGFTIDNVTLAIPEPSSFGALAGVAVLGFCATRRRRQA